MITVTKIQSSILNQERTIRIFVPDDVAGPFQVLYMYDGQNLFDKKTSSFGDIWDMETQVNRLMKAGLIPPLMVVGIDSTRERLDEYSPFDNSFFYKTMSDEYRVPHYGHLTNRFIVDELMHYININYHTLQSYNHIAGSSLGGLMALHAGLSYPKKFRGIGVFSLAAYFNKDGLKTLLQEANPERSQKLFLSVGTNESNNTSSELDRIYLETVSQTFYSLRNRVDKVFYRVYNEGRHTESFWAALIPSFLYFIFEK